MGNLSIMDTIGTQLAVLYREVSLIQRWNVRSSMWLGLQTVREVSFKDKSRCAMRVEE